MMAKSLCNNSHKENKMEFKHKEEIVIVDEKKTSVFEAKQVKPDAPKQPEQPKVNNWIDAYSDCA